jgi:hypothetical protein
MTIYDAKVRNDENEVVVVYATSSIHREKWATFESEELYLACADALDALANTFRMEITTSVEEDK